MNPRQPAPRPASDGFDPAAVPIREAATVMLVRDGGAGVEVFMMRRTTSAVFGGGFYVFPGGRIDPADRHPDVLAVCAGLDDATASRRLGVTAGGLGYWIAAIRECFEEAGVLLADRVDGSPLRFDDAEVVERFAGHRHAVHDGILRLDALCRAEEVLLTTGRVGYVSHWITPVGTPRRFDTRFLVAHAPPGQDPLHDDGETIASRWIRPSDALDHLHRGEWEMMSPTQRNLEFLADHATADAVMEAAHRPPRTLSTTSPSPIADDEGRVDPFRDDGSSRPRTADR